MSTDTKTIGKIFTWVKGKKPTQLFGSDKNNYIPYLTASYFRTKKVNYFTDKNDKNCVPVKHDEVVLIWDGSNAGDVFRGLQGVLSSTMVKFKNSDECETGYLYYLLKNNFSNLNNQTTGSTIPHVNGEVLRNISIPNNNTVEQKAIVRVLETVQNAIASQNELIIKLKELKQNMMHQLFTKGTKGEKTKMTEIGEVPESWEVVELATVCEKPQYGFTDSASNKGNVKFLRITDITEDGVNWENVPFCNCANPEKYLLEDKDIVFARIGATTGKSFLLKNPNNAVYASYLIRVRPKTVNNEFLYYYFQTDAYWKQINSQKGASLKGGVNGSILSKLLIPKCANNEQEKMAKVLSVIDQKIKVNQEKLFNYKNLFNTLLHELMSGERRIKY